MVGGPVRRAAIKQARIAIEFEIVVERSWFIRIDMPLNDLSDQVELKIALLDDDIQDQKDSTRS